MRLRRWTRLFLHVSVRRLRRFRASGMLLRLLVLALVHLLLPPPLPQLPMP